MRNEYDLIIVGGGIAGYSAALAAKNLKMDYFWLGDGAFGGKAARAETVRNYPAFSGNGAEFVRALAAQAEREGIAAAEFRCDRIYKVGGGYYLASGQNGFKAKAVILACGVEAAGAVAGEKEFLGSGVSYCAVCDGGLYRGKKVVAVLAAKEYEAEAEYLASFAERLTCVCRYPDPEIAKENVVTVSGVPAAVEGADRVTGLRLKDGSLIEADGIFFLKDSFPPEALVGGLETDGKHVKVGRDMSTNLAGLFAAGDVTGTPYQFIKAAGEGLTAAYSAQAFLRKEKKS